MTHSNTIKYEYRDMMAMDEEYGQFVILDDPDYEYNSMELKHIKKSRLPTINEYDYMLDKQIDERNYRNNLSNQMDDTILIGVVRYLVNIWSFFN